MPRRLPIAALVAGCAVVSAALLRPARADDAGQPDPAGTPAARVVADAEPADGGPVFRGTLLATEVTVETATGRTTVDARHLLRMTFQQESGDHPQDAVQLTDKSVVRGRVTDGEFAVRPADGPARVFKRAELREVRVVRDSPVSAAAILVGLVTLAVMEIVLGIDNIIFLAIVVGKLPRERQPQARRFGLLAALGTRIVLLFTLSFLLGLTRPVVVLPDLPLIHDLEAREVSLRDLILLAGGLFLIGKSVLEMHKKLEETRAGASDEPRPGAGPANLLTTVLTIAVIDIVFSLDSVITAVGMVEQVWVMVAAMVLAMLVMLWFSGPISDFVDTHPTIKVLALAFLILIGVMLVAEGLGQHIDKGYIYFAMAFAVVIELVNMRLRKGVESPGPTAV